MMTILTLGFFLGMRHALEADHIAAVASLTSRNLSLKNAIRQGAVWGLGHTLMLFIFGCIALMLNDSVPENLASWLEFVVGIMLVVLGIDVLRRLLRDRIHFHSHEHGAGVRHFHAHSHRGENVARPHGVHHDHEHDTDFPLRALFIGMIHGMAGSAVLVVLAFQSMTSIWTGLIYILLFGAGSIIGMAALSMIIAVPIRQTRSMTWLHNTLQGLIGTLTIALGASGILLHFNI